MKFSITMPYYNRRKLLLNTINSISKSALINDCEFIIADDASDEPEAIDDINQIYPNLNIKLFKFTKEEKWWTCPVIPHNKSIAEATGDVIIIQCPECFHNGDILSDIKNRIKKNDYLAYATQALNQYTTQRLLEDNDCKIIPHNSCGYDGNKGGWYQHGFWRNLCFNFCTAIHRTDLLELGGFDERYAYGVAWGDNDFILRIKRKGMNVISVDNPFAYHQFHETISYPTKVSDKISNEELYNKVLNEETGFKVHNSFLK